MPTSDPVQLFCLDRDGVINHDVGVPGVTDVRDFELFPDAARAIRSLNDKGVGVCVVTNQTAVGKGLMEEATLTDVIHPAMRRMLHDEAGADVGSIFYAVKDKSIPCDRRKPAPGMLLEAMTESNCMDVYYGCIMVGDTVTGHAGRRARGRTQGAGVHGARGGDGKGARGTERGAAVPDIDALRRPDHVISG